MPTNTQATQPSRRQEGFPGQQIAVSTPSALIHTNNALIEGFLPTAAGYFPRARGHYVRRRAAIADAIFLLCMEGSGWMETGELHVSLQPGDVGYVPAGSLHAYGSSTDRPWSLGWFHVTGDRVAATASVLGLSQHNPRVSVGGIEHDLPVIDELCHLLRPPHQLSRYRIASTLLRGWFAKAANRVSAAAHEPSLVERIDQSVQWLKANLDRPIRLADLAGQARLSVSRYSEVFRQIYGKPPIAFCTACRISSAAEQLVATDQKINEIAEQVGFTDPLHFSRVFKREMSQSPRQYRASAGTRRRVNSLADENPS